MMLKSHDEAEMSAPQETEEADCDDLGEDTTPPIHTSNYTLVLKRALSTQVMSEESVQRENIFQTRCYISGTVCSMIIDSGSCANLVNTTVVDNLKIATTLHPHPYKLQWLKDSGEIHITRQALIPISIGKLEDEVLCDVVPMHITHILLGRPWQYDRRVIYDGFLNKYTLLHKGRKISLTSLSPKEAHADQLQLAQIRERSKFKEEQMKIIEIKSAVEIKDDNPTNVVDEKVEKQNEESDSIAIITCSSSPSSSLQVHDDHPGEKQAVLFDTPNQGPIFPINILIPVDICGKPEPTFVDPFAVYCALVPDSHPCDYVAAPKNIICIDQSPTNYSLVSLVMYASSTRRSSVLKLYLRLVFDPGVSSLRYVVHPYMFLLDLLYDILLIRGRILLNREGMM